MAGWLVKASFRRLCPLCMAVHAAMTACQPAVAQTVLPGITVTAPSETRRQVRPKRARPAIARGAPVVQRPSPAIERSPAIAPQRPVIARPARAAPSRRAVARAVPSPTRAAPPAAPPSADAQTPAQRETARLDRARDDLFPRTGASVTDLGKRGIDLLPQGANQPLEQVLLQFPGVSQDTQGQGGFHIRNEHSNVQYRLNGVQLPEAGVAGFGQFLETTLVGNVALLTGALPAQYGLRTSGVLDIKTRSGAFDGGGAASLYGGSRGTVAPQAEYGGSADGWSYFVTGRALTSRQGLNNPAPSLDPIHDFTRQGRYFAYLTKDVDATSRFSAISGGYSGRFQIPNRPGLAPSFTAFGVSDFDSRALNENQYERTLYNVAAYQKSAGPLDFQLSAFSRSSTVRFVPDPVGTLLFNGNATDVFRSSLVTGLQADAAYRWDAAHTTRLGLIGLVERTRAVNGAIVLPVDETGATTDAPFGIVDRAAKTGYTLGGYAQHEWRLTDRLVLNAGLRFDRNWSFVTANQVSPRAGLAWTPVDGTTFHVGYARYFTPPQQVLASPTNIAAFAGTTQGPEVTQADPVRPERSHYFDIGVDHALTPNFRVGVDFYGKRARNLLDAGQFGPAQVLTVFNYDRGTNTGLELKAIYEDADLRAYGAIAFARQRATTFTSNQYLFEPDLLSYAARNYVFTDHAQFITASAGANVRVFDRTRVGFDLVYGSGLRRGFANTETVPSYARLNLGATHEFQIAGLPKPTALRFDVVNLFDNSYLIRDGSGIGVFAPQYGQRRGFYAGVSQRF